MRGRYVRRALTWLKPYRWTVAFAYASVLIVNAATISIPLIIRYIVDSGIRPADVQTIVAGSVLLLVTGMARGVFTYVSGYMTESASQNVAFDLRNTFHQKIQALSFNFHDQSESGQLLARSVQDVDRVRFLTGKGLLQLTEMGTLIAGVAVAALFLSYQLTLLAFSIVPVLLYSAVKFGFRFRPLSMIIRDREAILTSRLEQNIRGSRIVKAFGQEEREIQAFERYNARLLDAQLIEARLRAIILPLMQFLAGVGTLIVLTVGGRMVIRGTLTIGMLVAFTTYLALLLHPIRRFGWLLSAIARASASAERIFEILDLEPEVQDDPQAVELDRVAGAIRFDNVSFSYGRGRRVLNQLCFESAPGEKTALLGSTGSGKSSIIRLIPRFYDPDEGAIYLDGVDIRKIAVRSLRNHVGVVLQDSVLFASTIRANISFGRPEASQQQIEDAARAACIHDFIIGLPEGYGTTLGERAVTLSGGQRQRISIARALLKNPEVLILDDATSSVDTDTERHLQDALEHLMTGRTAIIIAQRLSTIRNADRVLVLERGRIAAVGVRTSSETPQEQLLRNSPLYADIFRHQLRLTSDTVRGDAR
ncbi:MAG: ABC transporter ATP-binding protein [Spirochaetaceae bacterium]|nr:MAG: ABC transporter ATP-binding protein [Spirochaetaceae bacterium]